MACRVSPKGYPYTLSGHARAHHGVSGVASRRPLTGFRSASAGCVSVARSRSRGLEELRLPLRFREGGQRQARDRASDPESQRDGQRREEGRGGWRARGACPVRLGALSRYRLGDLRWLSVSSRDADEENASSDIVPVARSAASRPEDEVIGRFTPGSRDRRPRAARPVPCGCARAGRSSPRSRPDRLDPQRSAGTAGSRSKRAEPGARRVALRARRARAAPASGYWRRVKPDGATPARISRPSYRVNRLALLSARTPRRRETRARRRSRCLPLPGSASMLARTAPAARETPTPR